MQKIAIWKEQKYERMHWISLLTFFISIRNKFLFAKWNGQFELYLEMFMGKFSGANLFLCLVVVVAQLEERSLPTPEICGSNPVIGKFYLLSV